MTDARLEVPFKTFFGYKSKLYKQLIQFGQNAYVTIKEKIKGNWKDRAQRGIMVGYAEDRLLGNY